jgi:hypothetical protein
MNRRDLLKRTGTLAMGLPALRASSLANSMVQSDGKYLVVNFSGPFCFWTDANEKRYTVMAPLVGKNVMLAAHQAWAATSENETILNSWPCVISPEYELNLPGLDRSTAISGTTAYQYPQEGPAGQQTLFTLSVPNPDEIIGIHPTKVDFKSPRAAAQSGLLAAGLTFVYKNVDVTQIMLTQRNNPKSSTHPHKCVPLNPYRPCFDNDATLPTATLNIHLSRVDQSGNGHAHANLVWGKMEEMYPWMEKTTLAFPGFNPAGCPPGPGKSAIGPGNDCEVPIMLLQLGGNLNRQKK